VEITVMKMMSSAEPTVSQSLLSLSAIRDVTVGYDSSGQSY